MYLAKDNGGNDFRLYDSELDEKNRKMMQIESGLRKALDNHEFRLMTIIDMGNHLNFKVIAEGIENEQQLSYLKENHCHYGQGYFLSKPLSVENFKSLLSTLNRQVEL